jgi:hypothetical protein
VIVLVISMGNTAIPPGKAIYTAAFPNTEEVASGYLVGGAVDAVTAIVSVINGVIYAFVAWLIYTIVAAVFKKDKQKKVQQQKTNTNQ